MVFKAGVSGNPSGRKPGIPDRRARLRDALEGDADELLQKAVQMAKDGDTAMLSLLISRMLPAVRPESAPLKVDLPSGSLADQAGALVEAAASGEIPASTAGELLVGMGVVAKLRELDELTKRLDALERAAGGKA
jgi:hypothetical protein